MASFGTPFQAHKPAIFFQHCWLTCILNAQVTPAIAWQTKEENPCLGKTHLWAAKGLNVAMADPQHLA